MQQPSLLIVVARDRLELWELWRAWFSGIEGVEVILDRRRGERQEPVEPHDPERPRVDRRRDPAVEDELRSSGSAITRP